jgi:hypothetical protein
MIHQIKHMENLAQEWELLLDKLEESLGKRPADLNAVLFLMGVQELGKGHQFFTNKNKTSCTLLFARL